jgi:ribonuclease HI
MALSQQKIEADEPEENRPVVRSDKYWRKTGNIFIQASAGGKPAGLMAAASDYALDLLDDSGKPLAKLSLDAKKLSDVLKRLEASGDITMLTVGEDAKQETGYLVPMALLPNIVQMMAGIDLSAAPKQTDNKTPITITTDGSFRQGKPGGKHGSGHGGGHVILERMGSKETRDDFRITLTWQATIRDSYESEVRGVLEALKYLEQGKKSCFLNIRCDNMGVVDTLNHMSEELQRKGRIATIKRTKPCAELWQQIADMIQVHSFSAEHARYNKADGDTIECHDNANRASRQWKDRGQEGKGR